MRKIFSKHPPEVNPEFSRAMNSLAKRTTPIRAAGLAHNDLETERRLIATLPNVVELQKYQVEPVDIDLVMERIDAKKYIAIAEVLGAVRSTVRLIPVEEPHPYNYEEEIS